MAQSLHNNRKTGKEQYYTNPEVVDLCIAEVKKHVDLEGKTILEPAGGTGEFIEGLRRAGINDKSIISYDIEPKHPLVKQADFLSLLNLPENMISITNPPFGRANSLSKQFFNHSADHCDFICYLVSKSWRKWSVMNALDLRFHLLADVEMPVDCFYSKDTNKAGVLNTVFQIWEKRDYKREKIIVPDTDLIKKVNSVAEANYSMVVFGHSSGRCEEITPATKYTPGTTYYFQVKDDSVKEVLRSVDWSKYNTNVSYIKAISFQEIKHEVMAVIGP
jgi:predicted RNA methylase